jgi:dienelactone hydrolase
VTGARCPLAGLLLAAALVAPAGAEVVTLQAPAAELSAHWLPAPGAKGRRPAVVALHGCGGLYRRDGKTFDVRYPEYVQRLHHAGYHVLLPDSFGPRGVRSTCTVPASERHVDAETRRPDVVAAVDWLARHPEVDRGRIALLGWSQGAMTALAAIDGTRAGGAAPLAGAVVFYPGCRALLQKEFRIAIPVLMLLGEKDDWTPPARCVRLAERIRKQQPRSDLTVEMYPDSYHGFDGPGPVHFRADVPNGVNRAGVHVGGNPAARARAQAAVDTFLARVLK